MSEEIKENDRDERSSADKVIKLVSSQPGAPAEREEEVLQVDKSKVATQIGSQARKSKGKKTFSMRKSGPSAQLLEQPRAQQQDLEEQWLEDSDSSSSKARSWVLIAAAICLAALFSGAVWAVSKLKQGEEKAYEKKAEIEQLEKEERIVERSAEEVVAERKRVVKAYLAANTVEEKIRYVRHPERVGPLMREYYKTHPLEPFTLKGFKKLRPHTLGYRVFWVASVEVEEDAISRSLLVEPTSDGASLVDWESNVVYQPGDWNAFCAERRTSPTAFRATIELVEVEALYAYEFSDYKKYRCFRVRTRQSDKELWGYTEIGSVVDEKIIQHFRRPGGDDTLNYGVSAPMIVSLRYPEDSMSANCVHIDECFQSTWVYMTSEDAVGPHGR